jgi:hypothetical protein
MRAYKLKQHKNILYKIQSRHISGYFFSRLPSLSDKDKNNKISIYEGPEWQELHNFLNTNDYFKQVCENEQSILKMYSIWEESIFQTSFKKKYFALLPFNIEDRHTMNAQKKFVLNMNLLPDSKLLEFTISMISGNFIHNSI